MADRKEIQALHAAISIRDWHAVEVAANVLRDQEARPTSAAPELVTIKVLPDQTELVTRENALQREAVKDARIAELEKINAAFMGDDEDKPRYTTKRLKHEIARATADLEAQLSEIAGHLECDPDSDSILHVVREIDADKAIYKERATELEAQFVAAKKEIDRRAMPKGKLIKRTETAEAEVSKLRKALQSIDNLDEAMGHNLTVDDAFTAVAIAHQALAKGGEDA